MTAREDRSSTSVDSIVEVYESDDGRSLEPDAVAGLVVAALLAMVSSMGALVAGNVPLAVGILAATLAVGGAALVGTRRAG